jgi:hypothetical protein
MSRKVIASDRNFFFLHKLIICIEKKENGFYHHMVVIKTHADI